MSEILGIVGYFADADALQAGIEFVERSNVTRPVAYLPVPDQPAVDVLNPGSSAVRWFSLVGGISGIVTALTMTIWMSWNYPLVVGGKPITSLPPFLVVAFELMVLFGSIGSIIGFLWMSRLPDLAPSQAYRPSMAVDHYALFIPCDGEAQRARAQSLLSEAGAVETEVVLASQRGRLEEVL